MLMSKKNLIATGNLIITRDGKHRIVTSTCTDGLIASTADGKSIMISKLTDDLDGNRYGDSKDVMEIWGPMHDISGRVFETGCRTCKWSRQAESAPVSATVTVTTYSFNGGSNMRKSDITADMLVQTRDGKLRLVVDTENDGLVAFAEDGKGIKLSKLDDDMLAVNYKQSKDIMKVWTILNSIDGRPYSTTSRTLLFDRDAYCCAGVDAVASDNTDDLRDVLASLSATLSTLAARL